MCVADAIERQTGLETRMVVSGAPPARRIAQRLRPHPGHPLGLAASRLVLQHRFGTLVTLLSGQIVETNLSEDMVPPRRSTLLTTTRPRRSSVEEGAVPG